MITRHIGCLPLPLKSCRTLRRDPLSHTEPHESVFSEDGHRDVEALTGLAYISHHPTVEARDTTAMTSLRLLAVLDVLSSTPARAKRLAPFSSARLAPSPGGPLTHSASPRGEKCRLDVCCARYLICEKKMQAQCSRTACQDLANVQRSGPRRRPALDLYGVRRIEARVDLLPQTTRATRYFRRPKSYALLPAGGAATRSPVVEAPTCC